MIIEHPMKRWKIVGVISTNITRKKLEEFLQVLDFHNYTLEETK